MRHFWLFHSLTALPYSNGDSSLRKYPIGSGKGTTCRSIRAAPRNIIGGADLWATTGYLSRIFTDVAMGNDPTRLLYKQGRHGAGTSIV